jgi:hypothetical protein
VSLIWATRGRSWGFRFIRTAGLRDPLPVYESAFAGLDDSPDVFRAGAETVALRFSDPQGRQDRAGRVIPHEFVVFKPLADDIHNLEDGIRVVWPLVEDEFAEIWDQAGSQAPRD